MRGLSVRLKGKGLIYNWISNYRGLSAKSVKELDCGFLSGKVSGLIAKCQRKSITGRIFFGRKLYGLSPRECGPRETAPVHGPWWAGLHTPLPASNPAPQIQIQWPEEEEVG
jgi:hypothetical protein